MGCAYGGCERGATLGADARGGTACWLFAYAVASYESDAGGGCALLFAVATTADAMCCAETAASLAVEVGCEIAGAPLIAASSHSRICAATLAARGQRSLERDSCMHRLIKLTSW